jgi:type I restriction enzyme S subunit
MVAERSICSLKEVGVQLIDCDHKTPKAQESGFPYIGIPQMKNGNIDFDADPRLITESDLVTWTRKAKPQTHDVILSRRCNPGETAYVGTRTEFALGQNLVILRAADERVFPPYLRWVVRSHQWWAEVSKYLNPGAVFDSLKCADIPKFEIPFPPLPEQKAIAHVLGSLDDKIELNRRMNETLEGMAQTLFKSWFVDFDPVIDNALAAGNPIPEPLAQRAETRGQAIANGTANRENAQAFPASFRFTEELGWIPEGWEESDVGKISSCYDKNRIPLSKKQREEKKPGLIPYYGATSVMDYINEWIFDDTFLLVGEDGSVMKDDGTPFTQYIWGKTWVNNHAHVLQGKGSISTEHLMLFMQSQNITAFVTGAVQMKINQGNLNSIPFLKAEDSTNDVFGKTISPIYQNIKNRIEESQTLAKLRDVLLPKLISGELRIPQAEKMVEKAVA